MSKFHGAKAGYEAGKQFLKKVFGKKGDGKAIKKFDTNVPKNELDRLSRDIKILEQKSKATKALVNQTNFEMKNPQFSKGRFTFDPNRKNVTKESVKKRNEESKKMFRGAQGKAKGGRVGLKFGSKKKSSVQKIKETFGPGSNNPKKSAAKKKKSFPDLTGDGKVTFADVLKGRGVKRG